MADRRIISDTSDFRIPKKESDNKSNEIIIKLSQVGRFDVYQKDYPKNLPEGYTWINNFGLKKRKANPKNSGTTDDTTESDEYENEVDEYFIELDDVEGKEPVYFDGNVVKNFPQKKVSVGNKRVRVTLTVGDPPVGWP